MTTDEATRLIYLHATDGNNKYGPLAHPSDGWERLQKTAVKAQAAFTERATTGDDTPFFRRIAQLAGMCYSLLALADSNYDDLALTIPALTDLPKPDPAADPQDCKA